MKRVGEVARRQRWGYAFIAPFFAVFLVFTVYPFFTTILGSFQKWDGIKSATFMGTSNYVRMLKDGVFYKSLLNTLLIWLESFIPQMATALALACVFTFNRMKTMPALRAAYYLPNLITAASIGILFDLMLTGDGAVVNQLLMQLGLISEPVKFMTNRAITPHIVSYILWWLTFGYTTILIMTGMTSVDASLYDAAMVDGAGKARTFLSITLPLIRPTLIYFTVTSVISGMQIFDIPAVLTDGQGSPQKSILTTAMYTYNQGFRNRNFGYACTTSVGLFVVIVALSATAYRLIRKRGGSDDIKG